MFIIEFIRDNYPIATITVAMFVPLYIMGMVYQRGHISRQREDIAKNNEIIESLYKRLEKQTKGE
jgi:hypothetical protein